jgi:2',3'-cyclic-nucleotide 2'-phosphodiesterase (5'-nucleotidase family)
MAKKVGFMLAVLALVLGLAAPCPGQPAKTTLTILHTNDTHSALLPFGHPSVPGPFSWLFGRNGPGSRARAALVRETGGIARMAALIKRARMRETNVLALNAGDVFVGSFEFNKYLGYPELKIMENLYDAMSLGNHEFDLGMDVLAGVVSGQLAGGDPVTMPLLCANVDFAKAPAHPLAGLIRSSIVKEIGGVKVGIFGIVNEDRVNFSQEVIDRFSGDVYTVAGTQAALLRQAEGCQVVIALSHLGTMGDLLGLADNVAGIDIIVGGHSHELFDDAIIRNGKIIVQAGSHGQYLGQLQVDFEEGLGVTFRDWSVTPVDSRVKPDPYLQGRLNALRDGVVKDPRFGPVYSRIVALVGRDISHDWPAVGPYRDAPLGNLVTDSIKAALTRAGYQVDCVLDALGYTEFGIPAGKVVGNDIMRAVPYGYDPATGLGFKLVIAPLPGSLILGGLEYTVAYVEYTNSLSAQVSGLTFAYDSRKPARDDLSGLSRVDPMSVKIGDEYVALNPDKYYMVAMTDQVFNFLNGLTGSQLQKIDTGLFEYNAVRDHMRSLRFVNAVSEGRILDVAAATAVRKR